LSLVAVHEDAIVGAVLGGHDGRRGLIHHLAVADSARRSGIGKRLLTECLRRLELAGIDKCHVLVFASNLAATNSGGRAAQRAARAFGVFAEDPGLAAGEPPASRH
jgi:ribosomal protein S18 acetylase RimI-like enzyme